MPQQCTREVRPPPPTARAICPGASTVTAATRPLLLWQRVERGLLGLIARIVGSLEERLGEGTVRESSISQYQEHAAQGPDQGKEEEQEEEGIVGPRGPQLLAVTSWRGRGWNYLWAAISSYLKHRFRQSALCSTGW
ncbi:hypothetical protein GN956_G13617 [Arapaima gigas]